MESGSVFDPVSPMAHTISTVFIIVLIIASAVFLLVAGLVTFVIIRYRARPGQGDPKQWEGNLKIELTWTGLTLLVLLGLFGLTVFTMDDASPATASEQPDIVVVGHQWWWEVRYPAANVVTANEIHIPSGQRLLLQLESADVIHDFWVPQLSRKMDMIPGNSNKLWIAANTPGLYLGACAEFCGPQHAWMRLRVYADPPEQFSAWLADQAQLAPLPSDALAQRGQQLFQEQTCVSCHAVTPNPTENKVGPNLAHFASRATIATGVLTNTPANLALWINQPQDVKPGVRMPNMKLDVEQIQALVAYLETLQ